MKHPFTTSFSQHIRKPQGFSLIELLVSMALIGILAGVGGSIFIMVNNANSRSVALSKLQTQNSQNSEVLERAIRSSGKATVLNPNVEGCLSDATSCLQLQIVTSSIEYNLNNNCYYTYYAWYAPTATANGRLVRYFRNQSLANCPIAASQPFDLFDTDPASGASVESGSAGPSIFLVKLGDEGINTVLVTAKLAQGVTFKPSSGADNRVTVNMRSSANLRNY